MSAKLKLLQETSPHDGVLLAAREIALERRAFLLEVKAALDCDDYAKAKSLMGELVNDETKGYRTRASLDGIAGDGR